MDRAQLSELRSMILNAGALPKVRQVGDPGLRKEIASFRKRHSPEAGRKATAADISSFIERHRLFELMDRYLKMMKEQGTTLVIVEGGDATGKSALTRRLARDLHGVSVINQSGYLFHDLFHFPKSYKSVVIDRSNNPNVAFLYYFVQNIYVLEKLLLRSAKKRFALLDSFVLRTMSSHRVHPGFSRGSAGRIIGTGGLKRLIERELNKKAIAVLRRNRSSLFFVFLYSSKTARYMQARERAEIDAFDINKKYYSYITDYLEKDQNELRSAGVAMLSMLTVEERERFTKSASMDAIFIRSKNKNADLRQKSNTIEKAIRNL